MQPPSPHWRFMGQLERRPSLPSLVLALVCILWFGAPHVSAQTGPATLVVQLRTAAGFPVPNAQVQVVEAASNRNLVAGRTDERGEVRFPALTVTEVRVVIAGSLVNGTALKQMGQDASGIWLSLPASAWLMDLRVDDDGAVTPDLTGAGTSGAGPDALAHMPSTGSTPSPAAPIADNTSPMAYPTARGETAEPRTALPRPNVAGVPTTAARVPPSMDAGVSGFPAAPTSDTPGIALLAVLMGMIAGVVWLSSRNKL